jgi:phosphatidylserine/phosphatidylglycerophosphate/cardiolipin synthase-like enzyme
VSLGVGARTTLCDAFSRAKHSIDVQFHSLKDDAVIDSLNGAARRGVDVCVHIEGDVGRYDHRKAHVPESDHVRASAQRLRGVLDPRIHWLVEADPLVLEHGKAAVVDDSRAFVATANANENGFGQPGEVLVEDDAPEDVAAIHRAIDGQAARSARVISGPDPSVRASITALLQSTHAVHIAIEDLSDPHVIQTLIERRQRGLDDEVLVKVESRTNMAALGVLAHEEVPVRTLPGAYLHDKYIDSGDRIYVGSANLTRNGLDEAREIGIIADARDFDDGAASLRAEFDRMWSAATPLNVSMRTA